MVRKTILLSVLVAWFYLLPVQGQETKPQETPIPNQQKPEEKPSPASKPASGEDGNLAKLETRLEKLQAELAHLSKTVADLKQHLSVLGQGLSSVDKSVEELKKDVAAVNTVLQQQMLAKRLDELQKELAQLREALKQETERLHAALGQAGKPEVRKAFAAPLPTGQIILRNDWSLPVTVSVDGIAYTLQPGQEQRVIRPAGTFSYEVHGWQTRRSRTLDAGEQFLIRIAFP